MFIDGDDTQMPATPAEEPMAPATEETEAPAEMPAEEGAEEAAM
jgi:hypothetical protein